MSDTNTAALTPMMRQYHEMKQQVPGTMLLFRMGDFYELFFDDAREVSRILGLTLTTRDKGENPVPMAGFPYHGLDTQLRKLLQAGVRVAICDQVEDPKAAVGLVKRDITRIVSPGTLTDDDLLDPRRRNYLVAIAPARKKDDQAGLAWVDLSIGAITVCSVPSDQLSDELARIEPAECLFPNTVSLPMPNWFDAYRPAAVTARSDHEFNARSANDLLKRHFKVATFTGFGVPDDSPGLSAAGAIIAYLMETQRTDLKHISRLNHFERSKRVMIDPDARRSLELVRTIRSNQRQGSLLDAIDKTVTAAGARMLGDWINQPLLDPKSITLRQSAIAELKENNSLRKDLRELLAQTYDIERLIARISTGRTNPRDLLCLRNSLRQLPPIKAKLAARDAPLLDELERSLNLLPELRQQLEQALDDDAPMQVRDGGIIKPGFHADLDQLRDTARGGKDWIANYQREQVELTGISNLKINFNKVFGFYLEVTNSFKDRVPADWDRKQTIKNAERYITPALKEYEQKVLTAEDRSKDLEYELFGQLREFAASFTTQLQQLAETMAQIDVLAGLAEKAASSGYVRPTITDDNETLIIAGRHPVLDEILPAGQFVPNDTILDHEHGRFMLITGPNMAGKSTFIRQSALITILGQIGSFVPAESATLGMVDRIFARVGAADELQRGQSTFMVEMAETANILNNATARSLVILDEIGRGTSTYDGVSLAWAIVEHLHEQVGCRTLFATHYHELIQLEKKLPGFVNYNVAVREWNEEVIFLHQIVRGGSDRSYGIHVARLAGIPVNVLKRAQYILTQLERDSFAEQDAGDNVVSPKSAANVGTSTAATTPQDTSSPVENSPTSKDTAPKKHRRAYHQLSLFPMTTAHPILDEIRLLDREKVSPDQLRELLALWQDRLAKE